MKLYYDCPLKAAYMAKEFKVRLDGALWNDNYLQSVLAIHSAGEKYYIDKDSIDIFKPTTNDLVRSSNGMCWIVEKQEQDSFFEGIVTCKAPSADYYKRRDSLQGKAIADIIIIQRNGKNFFMPRSE